MNRFKRPAMQCGFFTIGVCHPKTGINIGTLIRSAYAFGATSVFTIGRRYKRQPSAVKTDRHIPIYHYKDIADWRCHLPKNARVVAVELANKAISIVKFCHPKQAVYLLGAEDNGLPAGLLKDFPTIQIPGKHCLNVATAGSIIMYDRIAKAT